MSNHEISNSMSHLRSPVEKKLLLQILFDFNHINTVLITVELHFMTTPIIRPNLASNTIVKKAK